MWRSRNWRKGTSQRVKGGILLIASKALNCVGILEILEAKSERYWPEDGPGGKISLNDGTTVVKMISEDSSIDSDLIQRELEVYLKGLEEPRRILQLHFEGWPDHGVPSDQGPIVRLAKRLRAVWNEGGKITPTRRAIILLVRRRFFAFFVCLCHFSLPRPLLCWRWKDRDVHWPGQIDGRNRGWLEQGRHLPNCFRAKRREG